MPSQRNRALREHVLRASALTLMLWLLVRELRPVRPPEPVDVTGSALAQQLPRSSTRAGSALHVRLNAPPSPVERDWLAALRRAGTRVSWSGAHLSPLAVAAEPVRAPNGGTRLSAATARGAVVHAADDVGTLDSARVASAGAILTAPALLGVARLNVADNVARVAPIDSLLLRPVLVLGRAGWEAKFIVLGLEEAGWAVRARLAVAPDVTIADEATPMDTASISAIIALDTTVARYASQIAQFVSRGGGVVLAGDAARTASLRALAPGSVGMRVPGVVGGVRASAPLDGLGAFPILREKADAVVLERGRAGITLAARRVGVGRVAHVAYDDTWRWRMLGGDTAPQAHREWWSRVVASVAYVPRLERTAVPRLNPAPLAQLHERLGAASEPPIRAARGRTLPTWMIALLLATVLLAEWASRRFRGAR